MVVVDFVCAACCECCLLLSRHNWPTSCVGVLPFLPVGFFSSLCNTLRADPTPVNLNVPPKSVHMVKTALFPLPTYSPRLLILETELSD